MSILQSAPVQITQPDPHSKALADRLHTAIIRNRVRAVSRLLDIGISVELANRSGQTPLFCAALLGHLEIVKFLLKLGADPNRRCSIFCCTPVHAACWSGNKDLLTALVIAGGDLRLHDQHNRSPRHWALMQQDTDRRLNILSTIESFRQMAIKGSDLNLTDIGLDISKSHSSFKFPTKLRNTLAALGLVCSENCEYIGPLGNVQGTGFGRILYGHMESAAALWPVPLVDESELSDPDNDYCDVEAALNGLLPKGVAYRVGPSTEMIPRRWHQTSVTVRRLKDNNPPDVLFEELHNMSRLRHPGLLLLLGVAATQHWNSVQLIYEPVYQGSLHYRLHIMGSSIPMIKRITILQQICDALLFLHSKNLLHCSITSHAVHLISTSRAKLGSLETLIDHSASKRAYRKVPPCHWEWTAPWTSPESSRGEGFSSLSDVYSFCCLVWETCNLQVPWSPLSAKEINDMWRKNCNRALIINDSLPVHISSFLKLGLQPKCEEREEIDLQEIYLMLRLQAAALAHAQQKESSKNTTAPVPTNQHAWDTTVEERTKKRPESLGTDEDSETETEFTDFSQQNIQPGKQERLPYHLSGDTIENGLEVAMEMSNPTNVAYCSAQSDGTEKKDIAIKPASHTTERHSANCFMSRGRSPACHSIFSSSHNAKDDSAKSVKVKNECNEDLPETNRESIVEVGDPTFSSTPKHLLQTQRSVSFLACSSRVEETGAKPKKSLKFPNITLPPAIPQHFCTRNKPTTEFVASLTAIFAKKGNIMLKCPTGQQSSHDLNAEHQPEDVSSTVINTNRVSRGIQCQGLD